jgi:hypothetical protein
MSESCLVIHPTTRNEGMGRDSGMGITSRGTVGEIGTFRTPDRSSQNSPVHPSSPRQVTDESETSECKKKTKSLDSNTKMRQVTANDKDATEKTPKRKLGSLQRSGPVLEEEQQSSENASSGPCSERNRTLPQHERIQEVEALDISYCCTPASLKLKAVLVSRLSDVSPSGRIQVVRSMNSLLSGFDGFIYVAYS